MANDLFGLGGALGGLGGLMGGLAKSGLIPQDTSEGKLLKAQGDLADLQKQETDLLIDIGRQAYAQNPSAWPQDAKLKLILQNLVAAQAALRDAKQEQKQEDEAKAAEDAKGRCPNCGHKNPEGVKFCHKCGNTFTQTGPKRCMSCGAALNPGIRFCGECGVKQGD